MKELVYILIVILLIGAMTGSGVVKINWSPPQDTANLEARVLRLEKVAGIIPNGRLVVPDFERARP